MKASSKYLGVYKFKKGWVARINIDRLTTHITYTDSEIIAALSYDKRSLELYGNEKETNIFLGLITLKDLNSLGLNSINDFDIPIPPTIKSKSSTYKGVSWVKSRNKWMSSIKINGYTKNFGYFDSERDAAIVRDNFIINNNINNKTNVDLGLLTLNNIIQYNIYLS